MAEGAIAEKGQEKPSCNQAVKILSTTPPEHSHLPLTPPTTVERARQAPVATDTTLLTTQSLQTYADKARTSDARAWINIAANEKQYEAHKETIKRLFRRHDFDPDTETLTLRMPGPTHEFFTGYLGGEIQHQLRKIASGGGDAALFAANIADGRTSRLKLDRDESAILRREPDVQFQHGDAKYPGLVVEVSHSQDGKKLKKIAQDYILYSNGNIKVVVGVDFTTGGEASLSIWRTKKTWSAEEGIHILEAERTVNQLFRTCTGESCNESTNLELHLADFATDVVPCKHDVSISVPYKMLYDFLCLAERMKRLRQSSHEGAYSRENVKRRRSTSSAEEEIQSEDETRFQEMEDKVERQTSQDEKAYVGPVKKRR